jgi:hypothetical protein
VHRGIGLDVGGGGSKFVSLVSRMVAAHIYFRNDRYVSAPGLRYRLWTPALLRGAQSRLHGERAITKYRRLLCRDGRDTSNG